MSIAYRNEEALPGDPSGRYGYGLTEWEDLEAAVALALEQGAREITLAGFSMGGGVVARFLEQSPLAASVCAVVFDAPMLDFEATVRFQASERGLPGPLVWLGKHAASWWYDVDWNALDYLSRMDDTLQVPTLVLHGLDDDQVPISISRELADRLPGRVTLEEFPGAGHVQAWNVDRQRYEGAVTAFYASGGPAAACAPS